MSDDTAPWQPPSDGEPLPEQLIVLIVDDDELVRLSTARALRRAGYRVLEAASADEALICMDERGDDVRLMLSDVIMPKTSGYDLGRAVQERWPGTKVVLISGYTPVAMDRHGIGAGDFRLLQKPVADLAAVVARLIGPPQRPWA